MNISSYVLVNRNTNCRWIHKLSLIFDNVCIQCYIDAVCIMFGNKNTVFDFLMASHYGMMAILLFVNKYHLFLIWLVCKML